MDSSSQDKQLPATERKLQQARKEGQAARSRDLSHLAVLGMGAVSTYALAPTLVEHLQRAIAHHLAFNAETVHATGSMLERLQDMTIVGMGAVSVAVIGGPLTMTFIALETTGDFWLTTAVLIAIIIAAQVTRETFGYSFATWRFHLRGEAIRSAVDIGWMRNLTVGRMMRREMRTVRAETPLSAFKRDFPLGATQRVIALDEEDRYAGIVLLPEAHADADDDHKVRDIVHYAETVLLPQMTIKEAVAMFENAESDALVVVDNAQDRRVIGLLTEAHALRRYAEELDRARRDLIGEVH